MDGRAPSPRNGSTKLTTHGHGTVLSYDSPRNIVPVVSTSFNEVVTLLQRAEVMNIPYVSKYRANLAMYAYLYPSSVLPN
jgi:hypothetical protein